MKSASGQINIHTVIDLISEHPLISGHPLISKHPLISEHPLISGYPLISGHLHFCWWRLLRCFVRSCFMLINHPTDGATCCYVLYNFNRQVALRINALFIMHFHRTEKIVQRCRCTHFARNLTCIVHYGCTNYGWSAQVLTFPLTFAVLYDGESANVFLCTFFSMKIRTN